MVIPAVCLGQVGREPHTPAILRCKACHVVKGPGRLSCCRSEAVIHGSGKIRTKSTLRLYSVEPKAHPRAIKTSDTLDTLTFYIPRQSLLEARPMTLESGVYIISCRGTQSYLGRSGVADKTLLARRIISLPRGIEAPRFIVGKSPQHKGCYIIRAVEGFVAEKDSLLWAFLVHDTPTPANMWHVNPQVEYGQNTYTYAPSNARIYLTFADQIPH